jgi:hypothetical protein
VFSEAVTGVDTSDFSTSGDDQFATITNVSASNTTSNTYIVEVTVTGPSAQLALALFDNDSIVNAAGIPLGGIGASNGNAVSDVVSIDTSATHANTVTPQKRIPHTGIDAPLSSIYSVGYFTSIALTTANVPVISYLDATSSDLKLAICNDLACTNPTISTIDITGSVGIYTSIALTTANIPVISYWDSTNADLKLAVCNNPACTNPTISTLDSAGDAGLFTSIALTTENIPVISYYDATSFGLKIAVCNDAACSRPTTSLLDRTGMGVVGFYTSIALTTTNIPVISYYDNTNRDLKIATCNNPACTSPTIVTLDSAEDVGMHTSIALSSTDVPVISYYDDTNSALKIAMCNDPTCTSPIISTLDNAGDVGMHTSIALSSANVPVISYYDDTNSALKLATCNDPTCTSPIISTLDSHDSIGIDNSIALTTANVPVISYYDASNGRLKLYTGPSIVDNGQPNSFNTLTPTNNQRIATASATLTWAESMHATSYEYCFALTAQTCTNWNSVGTSTNVTNFNLAHNTTYYWQVRARNDAGTTLANRGTPWQFTVVLPPVSFAKSAPANNATRQNTNITLTWAASTRATSYEYCIALTTASCTNWKSTGTARTVTVTGLAKNKTYFWQVRAKNAGGTTLSNTTFWKFTTAR